MPFIANTPESLVGRSDSKNPSSTCCGITSNGRACRRPVSPTGKKGMLDPNSARSYCYQHKEQAQRPSHSRPVSARPSIIEEGQERDSIDTLADRLGLMELNGGGPRPPASSGGGGGGSGGGSKFTCCFCFTFDLGDSAPPPSPVRPQPRPYQGRPTSAAIPSRLSSQKTDAGADILPTTDSDTASALMKELARPWVESEEPGYIYMFWMTPESKANPPVEAARSLPSPLPARDQRDRRFSDVVSSFAEAASSSDRSPNRPTKKMLLKIGRAANVQRRMNQWQRQCGYDIEVLRFYPWVPSSGASGNDATPRMTPHCHRVERLIHIELTGLGLRVKAEECEACGKEHREWFEAEATREGVRVVDEVIRRWISWDESLDSGRRRRR